MDVETNLPILSICIPIYNRSEFLVRILDRFLEDRDLFEEKVYFYISDNCSTEDLKAIVDQYVARGLNVHYHRNEENIGGDRNICACFRAGKGRYTWVMGSDDILVTGFLRQLLPDLEAGVYGLVALGGLHGDSRKIVFQDTDSMIADVHIQLTGVSQNIVATESVPDFDFQRYVTSGMAQVLLYMKAAGEHARNLSIHCRGYLEDDHAWSGGYDPFQVFGTNLLSLVSQAVKNGWIGKRGYRAVKRNTFRYFLCGNIYTLLIMHREGTYDARAAWKMLWKNYSYCPYAYYYMLNKLFTSCWNLFFEKTLGLKKLRIRPINVQV